MKTMRRVFQTQLQRHKESDDDLRNELARLQAENRRLKQVTQRIATKIGCFSSAPSSRTNNSGDLDDHDDDDHDDDDEGRQAPPPHLILAQAHRLQKLNQLVVELSQVPRLDQAYKIVAQYTREIVGAVRVSVAILVQPDDDDDDDGNNKKNQPQQPHLELYGLDGTAGAMPLGMRLQLHNTQVGHVVTTQQPVRVMDTSGQTNPQHGAWLDIQHLSRMGVQACVDVPLLSSGRVLGTLNTAVTDPAVYYPEVEQMLLQISAVLASAMEKERLWQLAVGMVVVQQDSAERDSSVAENQEDENENDNDDEYIPVVGSLPLKSPVLIGQRGQSFYSIESTVTTKSTTTGTTVNEASSTSDGGGGGRSIVSQSSNDAEEHNEKMSRSRRFFSKKIPPFLGRSKTA